MKFKLDNVNFSVFITFAVLSGTFLNLIPFPSQIIYFSSFILVLLLLLFSGKLNFIPTFFLYIFSIVLSLLLSDSPAFFRQDQRFLAFLLVLLAVGPIVSNPKLRLFRVSLFNYLNWGLAFVTIGSFLGYTVGYFSIETGDVSGLIGLSRHSMSLSGFAGLTAIFFLNEFYKHKDSKLKIKIFYILLIFISLIVTVLAGSRAALIASLLGCLLYVKKIYRYEILKFFKILVFVIVLVSFSAPFWLPYTQILQNKMEASKMEGSLTSSRDGLWDDRINEFNAHPIFGSGFASIDTKITKNSIFNPTTGTMEPGTSWLFLLSSVGFIGFVCFAIPFLLISISLYKSKSNILSNAYLFSLCGFYVVHLSAEGYIMAAGEFSFVLLWLTFSVMINNIALDA